MVEGKCTVPWEAELSRLPPSEQTTRIHQIAGRLVEHVQSLPGEDNLPRQIRYYTRHHRRLAISGLL